MKQTKRKMKGGTMCYVTMMIFLINKVDQSFNHRKRESHISAASPLSYLFLFLPMFENGVGFTFKFNSI